LQLIEGFGGIACILVFVAKFLVGVIESRMVESSLISRLF